MKLLFVIQNFRQGSGGAPKSVRLMARRLAHLGFSCDVASSGLLRRNIENLAELPPSEAGTSPFDRSSLADYAAIVQAGPWQRPDRVRQILSRRGPGQRHFYLPRGGLAAIEFEGRRPWLKRLYFAAIERRFAAGADAIVYSSELERRETHRLAGRGARQTVIPDFFEASRAELGAPGLGPRRSEGPVTLGFLAHISPHKGLYPFVRGLLAWRAARRPPRPIRLLVGGAARPGAEAYLEEVRSFCRSTELVEIDFLGGVGSEERESFYASVDIFVAPSLFESYCLTVLEAAAAGCRILCGPNIGVLEQLRGNPAVAVLDDLSPPAIARELDRNVGFFQLDPASRLAKSAAALQAIEEINGRAAQAWLDLLRG